MPGNKQKILTEIWHHIWLKMVVKKFSIFFEIQRWPSEIPANLPGQFSLSGQNVLHWAAATLKAIMEFWTKIRDHFSPSFFSQKWCQIFVRIFCVLSGTKNLQWFHAQLEQKNLNDILSDFWCYKELKILFCRIWDYRNNFILGSALYDTLPTSARKNS